VAGVFHRGDCADGPRPVGLVALAGEGSITDADLPELGCTLHVRALAHFFLLATLIEFLTLQFVNSEAKKPWNSIPARQPPSNLAAG
jgi:hypothetical protein